MSKPVLLSLGAGKVQELAGTANNDVLTWNSATSEWVSAAGGGGGGSGTVTSVGLTGGTSGIVIGGTTSPITTSGTYNLDAPLRFAFNTATPTEVAAAGQISYNTDEGSLEQMFDGGHVKSVLGQTLHQRVLNETGSTLTKGQVVYVSGAQGNRVTVDLALADADSTSATIIGLVAYAIADAAEGYVITEGVIKGVNTNGFTEGLPVYLSPTTPGALTQTKPEAPQHLALVGYCVRADTTVGEILVKTQNGYELGELHDVYINSPTSGQILIYDATAGQTRWENASLTGTANQITVTPGAGSLTLSLPSTLKWSSTSTASSYVIQAGDVTTTPSTAGSTLTINGGAANGGGLGGGVVINGGTSSTFTGGTVTLRAGTGSTNGDISIGETNTANVYIGSASITSRIYGTLTLPTNALAAGQGGTGVRTASANTVFAGPTTGAAAAPSFRALVAADFAGLTPYDVLGRFAGNPATNAVLYSSPVPRSVTVSTTTGNHYFYASALPSAGTSVITVYKTLASNGTKSALFTATWTAGQAAASNGLYQAVIGTVSNNTLVAGDVLSVEMGTTNTSFVNPQFAVSATA